MEECFLEDLEGERSKEVGFRSCVRHNRRVTLGHAVGVVMISL